MGTAGDRALDLEAVWLASCSRPPGDKRNGSSTALMASNGVQLVGSARRTPDTLSTPRRAASARHGAQRRLKVFLQPRGLALSKADWLREG